MWLKGKKRVENKRAFAKCPVCEKYIISKLEEPKPFCIPCAIGILNKQDPHYLINELGKFFK